MGASASPQRLQTITDTNFRVFLQRRNTQRRARLQRREEAGVADKKHLPQSVQILRQSSTFSRSDCVDSICFANTAVGPGLPVTRERFVRTPPLDRSPQRRMEAYVCLNESRGLISGCRGRPSLFRDHTRSGQPQIKGIVF